MKHEARMPKVLPPARTKEARNPKFETHALARSPSRLLSSSNLRILIRIWISCSVSRLELEAESQDPSSFARLWEIVLTHPSELPIVRPPFGKSSDFL
jgi:hypothetical protein